MNKVICTKSNVLFNVEKVKNNSIPKHFFTAKKRTIKIGDLKVEVMMNADRTQYVAFAVVESDVDGQPFTQAYYVRDHAFFEGNTYAEVKKPIKIVKPTGEIIVSTK